MIPQLLHLRYRILVSILLIAFVIPAYVEAETYTDDYGIEYTLKDDKTACVTNGKKAKYEEIKVFGQITYSNNEYKVTKIENNAFESSTKITKITIIDGLTEIGAEAFKNCSNLVSIYLPPSLGKIDGSAFVECGKLKNIYFAPYNAPSVSGEDGFIGIEPTNNIGIRVPEGYVDNYIFQGSPFAIFGQIIEATAKTLGLDRPELVLKKAELIFEPNTYPTLQIGLDNATYYTNIKFDLFLPQGLSININSAKINSTTGTGYYTSQSHNLYVSSNDDGSYHFKTNTIQQSSTYNKFSQEDNLISITLIVAENFEGGEISFKNTVVEEYANVIGQREVEVRDKVYMARIPEVLPEVISLDKNSVTLEVNKTETLTVTFEPDNTTNKSVTWTSSDTSVATVSSTGVITGVAVGNATITAKTINDKSASCSVEVTGPLYGDANNNGHIDIEDVTMMVDYILERNPSGIVVDRGDIDRNGKIDVMDVTKTIKLILSRSAGN